MRSPLLVTLCTLAALHVSAFAKTGWLENFDKAKSQAKTEEKLLLMDFTGSDWCGWCMKLDKEVFSTNEFKQYAKDKLVLLELDYPQGKRQTTSVKKQNAELAQTYKVQGYPTVIVLSPEGEKIGTLGYQEGGPAAFIAAIEKLQERAENPKKGKKKNQ